MNSHYFERSKKLHYCVKQRGYAKLHQEDSSNITNASDLLHDYYIHYPEKPDCIVYALTAAHAWEENSLMYEVKIVLIHVLQMLWS